MDKLKAVCKILNLQHEELKIKDTECMLINGKVFFPDNLFSTAEGRDYLHRAYLTYIGIDSDNYYYAISKEIK